MKFPFFRAAKTESAKAAPLVLLRRPTPPLRLRDTQRIALDHESTATAGAPKPGANGATVAVSARSVLAQLPVRLFAPGAQTELQNLQLHVPAAWVLPQLSTGRCEVRLGDLLPLLPADTLQQPPPVISEQQLVSLPLHEVIAGLSPDLLQTKPDKVINLDTPEFTDLPALFTDEFIQQAEAAAQTEAPAEPVAVAPPPAAEAAEEVAGQHVLVSLRSLVAALPEVVFCCARADLPRRADLNARVPLPAEPMISQLNTGRVRLPVATVLRALPAEILAQPLPDVRDDTVPLPLGEIIPQLPAHLFQESLTSTPQEVVRLDDDIPTPFEEKIAPVAAPVAQPEPVAPTTEPPLATVPAESFADDNFAVFAEKTAPVAPAAEELTAAIFAERPAPVVPPAAEPVSEEVPAAICAERTAPIVPVVPPAAEPVVEEAPAVIFAERTAHATPVAEPVVEPVARAVKPVVEPVAAPVPVEPVAEVVAPVAPEPEPVEAEAETASVTGEAAEAPAVFDERKCLINLNRCTVDDLLTIEGIGPALARRIISYRDAHTQFNSLDDLRQIPGIGRKTFRALVGSEPRSLNQLLGAPVDRELTLQEVGQYTAQLPGVTGCVLAMNNGLFVTGQVPAEFDQNAMSVFAPQLFRKIGRYTKELKVGQVKRMTIFTEEQPLSIFQAGEVYLVIIHDTRRFSKALLRRLERISRGLAALCRNRAVV